MKQQGPDTADVVALAAPKQARDAERAS